jgi:hypothetical protein
MNSIGKCRFEDSICKEVNISVRGNGGVITGTVVSCDDTVLTLSTRWSSKHNFVLQDISAYWFSEDAAEE